MKDEEHLQSLAETYLKSLIADVSGSADGHYDSTAPFSELGVDSFRVLKIVKRLEQDFGTLPKTLLFENFNIRDLAGYFVSRHREVLAGKVAGRKTPAVVVPVRPSRAPPAQIPPTAAAQTRPGALVIAEAAALRDPGLRTIVSDLFDRHKNEAGASRGARNIAPHLFIGSTRRGYFNFARCKDVFLAYAYTGPLDYFAELAQETQDYCVAQGLQLNIFADRVIESIGTTRFSATPFGCLQQIVGLQDFSLEGGAMRRLRYQVTRFAKVGACRTVEYVRGTDPQTDRAIAAVIDQWCAVKPMVNPLIHIVKSEILAGTLDVRHRLFLTCVDDVLQNVILISPLAPEYRGYLMDLEFYREDMPLGGLEFAIVEIAQILAREGCDMLSLGGTYGARIETCAQADPAIDRILDGLQKQNIFNDDGNFQFKNKFRPRNRSIYLCRPAAGGSADNILDIIMMIADPAATQTPVEASSAAPARATDPSVARRTDVLTECGFNPLNVPHEHVELDLRTDSWAQLKMPAIEAQMKQLRAQLQRGTDVDASLRAVFPFTHILLTSSGSAAESLLYQAWPRKGDIPQNLLFASGLFHQIDKDFTPVELPCAEALDPDSPQIFKADLAWAELEQRLAAAPGATALVCVEVSSNAVGGLPVSLAHLKKLRTLLTRHSIPLVLDATRVIENARFSVEHEPELAGRETWSVVDELLSQADAVTCSLTKDFCINRGGLIATNDGALFSRIKQAVGGDSALGAIDRKLVGLALEDRRRIETQVVRRMESVRLIGAALEERGVPVVRPFGGHCILLDVKRVPEFQGFEHPVASFLAWMYQQTGIAAAGHGVGMQRDTALNGLVRLAIPVGLSVRQVEEIIHRVSGLFTRKEDIPRLVPAGQSALGDVHANYTVLGTQFPSRHVEKALESVPVTAVGGSYRVRDIAIIGMAGRYPGARNPDELWSSLSQGVDCIREIPPERYERGMHAGGVRYRGGFIDDVDRFDSLFFNISPREAELLDPQERLFLEVAWEAIEDAGYFPETLTAGERARNIGVFVGAVWAMYQMQGINERHVGEEVSPNSFFWSIANRVSYYMNLCGPSLTLDTACSSSLTAFYLACEAIYKGDCSAAIVGGVNLDLHRRKLDINRASSALSKDGVCRSFGKGGDGYVAGEGIGALLIKPLEDALRDGDPIHGVIKSVAVNHGGRSSGYTVPNPKAQTELIAAALERAGVDARSIGYIEAHGTGTELGDPIEITGLVNAFEKYSVPSQTCGIGSVKTNIGHLEAAAGLVGVCKVLLQMRHGMLAPSLHSAELNPFIDFANSPFHVVQKLEPWQRKEVDGVLCPLRAGVSSFGAGGSNAHIILENYELGRDVAPEDGATERVFPLSARNEEQLRQVAVRLKEHIERNAGISLQNISCTLKVGRKSFEHRAVILAATRGELLERLSAFIDGKKDPYVVAGSAKNAEVVARLLSRQEQSELATLLARGRDLRKLAQSWADGLLADWRAVEEETGGRRISLPTYPFADRRHWFGGDGQVVGAGRSLRGLHPLIDTNESTFERQIFKKTFHVGDFFMADHRVAGVPTLPGVAYLEFARKAAEAAAGRKVRRIRNVLWLSPIAVKDSIPQEVSIELKPSGEAVHFEVFSEGSAGARVLHSQGQVFYATRQEALAQPEYIDLASIRTRCRKVIEGKDAYPIFHSLGLHLGPSFQVLREVFRSDTETLGALKLPVPRQADLQTLLLHPSLVDGSLQAGAAARLGKEAGEMVVPYSIGEVEILHPLQADCWSYVTVPDEGKRSNSRVSKANVLIVDPDGKVLVRIRETTGVPLREVHKSGGTDSAVDTAPTLYYSPEWREEPAQPPAAMQDPSRCILFFDTDSRMRDLCGDRAVLVRGGERYEEDGERSYRIDPRDPEDFARLCAALRRRNLRPERVCFAATELGGPQSLLFCCQALARHLPEDKVRILYLFRGQEDDIQPQHEAIAGFAKALQIEHPKLSCRTLELRGRLLSVGEELEAVLGELGQQTYDSTAVRYEGTRRHVRKLQELDLGDAQPAGLKEQGVYLITGGAGGLGLIFAEFLARQFKARLVLTGRSDLGPQRQARLDDLSKLGAEVMYVKADVADREQIDQVVAQCRSRFGRINGVIHAAGVLRDSFIRNKTSAEMQAVFAPKVAGTINLDGATEADELDFFALFSSLSAIGGNAGQCDYCYANYFMDSFAFQREALRARGMRHGKTLSLNWSLWAEGGMKLDEQSERIFRKATGIQPLQTVVGLESFLRGLASDRTQIAVVTGDRALLELAWGLRKPQARAAARSQPDTQAAGDSDLVLLVQQELARIAMDFLKLDASDIATDAILLDLGFDSIGLATYANKINDRYQLDLTPILFFEYPSISEIARHLAAERRIEIQKAHQLQQEQPATQTPAAVSDNAVVRIQKGWKPESAGTEVAVSAVTSAPAARRFATQPIAIVGMSGVMPQSESLKEFWESLRAAKELVTVVPEDRWRWQEHFGDPFKEANKTHSKWGAFMKEVDKFDPAFFGISAREAHMMDPQQRIFLQTVWSAIEDSGHKVSDLSGTRTGLFVGVATSDYINLVNRLHIDIDAFTASGTAHSVLANRISFLLNLRGPSSPIDTACSSSLVALHRAIESIHTGSCEMAIVGGVQVMLTPAAHVAFSQAGRLSNDGKCRTFDKRGTGYVRGEGAGALFLKPLARAEADGDHIYAVIRGTAENHGGRVTMLTAPNANAQTELLLDAYEKAGFDPSTVGYIECHGTGSTLGDSIEVQALTRAFAQLYERHGKPAPARPHCGLSALKSNIGHLETAAGVAGIIKILLALQHREIPATLHQEELNPYINLEGTPFYIVDKTIPWDAPRDSDNRTLPRRAGISSFGFGGANAHIVLEEYVPSQPRCAPDATGPHLIVLSAKGADRLKAYAQSLLDYLEDREVNLTNLAYTLQVGRDPFAQRLAFLASDQDEVRSKLRDFLQGEPLASQGSLPADVDEQIRELLGRGDLAGLGELWMEGAQIDWRALYASDVPERIPLPTYPFAKTRYWLPEGNKRDEARLHVVVSRNTPALKEPRFALNSGELHE